MTDTSASIPAPLQGFKQTHIYEGRLTVPQIIADMAPISQEGQIRQQQRDKWTYIFIGAVLGAILSFVVLIICCASNMRPIVTGVLSLLLVADILLAIISKIVSSHYRALLIDPRMPQFVDRILKLISADMAPDAPVKLRLDLRPANHTSKLVKKGRAYGWDVKYYTNPWLALSGKFLDGTSFDLSMLGKLQERSKTKRNARGKSKTKTKSKEALRAAVQLWVKPQRYGKLADLVKQAQKAVQLPQGVVVRSLVAQGESIELEAMAPNWDSAAPGENKSAVSGPHMVAMMFLSLYQVLNWSKAMNKEGGGAA